MGRLHWAVDGVAEGDGHNLDFVGGSGVTITSTGDEIRFDAGGSEGLLLGDAQAGSGGEFGGGDWYYGTEPGTATYNNTSAILSIHDNPGHLDSSEYEVRVGIEVDRHETGSYTGGDFAPLLAGIISMMDWNPTGGVTDTNDNNMFGITSQTMHSSTAMAPYYMRAINGIAGVNSGAARMGATDIVAGNFEVYFGGTTPADGTPSSASFDAAAIVARVNNQRPNGTASAIVVKAPIGSGTQDVLYGLRVRDQSGHADTTYGIGFDGSGIANGITWAGDTNLYRASADQLRTDDAFVAGARITGLTDVATPTVFADSFQPYTGSGDINFLLGDATGSFFFKSASAQSDHIMKWADNSNNVLAYVNAAGAFGGTYFLTLNGGVIMSEANAGGYIEIDEATGDAGGATDKVRLFCKDVAGKTKLYAVFQTGAIVLVATEP